jgi:hypothetical protein
LKLHAVNNALRKLFDGLRLVARRRKWLPKLIFTIRKVNKHAL